MIFSTEQLGAILAALPDPAFVLTRSGKYAAIFGGVDVRYYHDGSGLVGLRLSDVLVEEKAAWFQREIDAALASRRLHIVEYGLAGSDVKGLGDDGPASVIWFEGRIQALDFLVHGEEAVLWVASNISERHLLAQQLRAQSETDALTGLRNRRHFERTAAAEIERSRRYGSSLSMLMFDVDHFKLINDTYGHGTGDQVLVTLAERVSNATRESDSTTRWGGEEFTVLMPGTTLSTATDAAEKLRRIVGGEAFPEGLRVTISVGVAEWQQGENLDSFIARVDEALYRAKEGGRNRVVQSPAPAASATLSVGTHRLNLRWSKRYESGNADIDSQHKALFDQVLEIIHAAARQESAAALGGQDEVTSAIDRLLADVAQHFRWEEQMLERECWAGMAAHRAEHGRLLAHARELRSAWTRDASHAGMSAFAAFLATDVIVGHMLRSDRQFFPIFGPQPAEHGAQC